MGVHIAVSQSVAENCTLEPVVLPLATATLSILQLLGTPAARRCLRCSARFMMERGESFSWHGSSVNNRENTARSARQCRARTLTPAFLSLLLSKSLEIKETALESNAVWKE